MRGHTNRAVAGNRGNGGGSELLYHDTFGDAFEFNNQIYYPTTRGEGYPEVGVKTQDWTGQPGRWRYEVYNGIPEIESTYSSQPIWGWAESPSSADVEFYVDYTESRNTSDMLDITLSSIDDAYFNTSDVIRLDWDNSAKTISVRYNSVWYVSDPLPNAGKYKGKQGVRIVGDVVHFRILDTLDSIQETTVVLPEIPPFPIQAFGIISKSLCGLVEMKAVTSTDEWQLW